MKVIGITGGIGAGKTAVLSYMEKNYNCRILLADEAAHQVKEPGPVISGWWNFWEKRYWMRRAESTDRGWRKRFSHLPVCSPG